MKPDNAKSHALLCLAALLLASGCTHIGFQRGGTAAGFEEARNQCKIAPAEDYESCMRKAGWLTGGPSIAPPAKTAAASPAPKQKPALQDTQPIQQSIRPAVEKDGESVVAESAPPSAKPPHPQRPPAKDTAMVAAGSWWKIGGSAAALNQALKACGAAPTDRMVSHATLTCMKAKGWYAQGS